MRYIIPASTVHAFKSRWPCSGLPSRPLYFEEDGNGNLLDISTWTRHPNVDGRAVLALMDDHKRDTRRKIYHGLDDVYMIGDPPPYTSVPCERCGHEDRTQCEHGHRLAQLAESVCNPENSP